MSRSECGYYSEMGQHLVSPEVRSPDHRSLVESPGDRTSDKENAMAINYKSKSSGTKGLEGSKSRKLDLKRADYLNMPL